MLEGWEWLIIGVVAIVIIIWGPSKIPEFAKALGKAKGEFKKGTKEFTDAANLTEKTPDSEVSTADRSDSASGTNTQALKSKDDMLLDTARGLGIETTGKTREQLTEEISAKVKLLNAD